MPLPARRAFVGAGLLAAAAVTGVLAVAAPSANASTSPTPPATSQISSGSGAVDLQGREVPTRTYVGDTPPADLGELSCAATVSVDGSVTATEGDCSGLQQAAP